MPGIVTAVVVDMHLKAPLAKGGWFCLWQNRGDKRLAGFHIGLYFQIVPAVQSLSHGFAVPAPFDKGAAGGARRQFPTEIFSKSLLP
jgi:hypothetical protein